ncbi:hypothetical protein MGSAQ_001409, partial [marine sediment metagenome]
IYSKKVSPLDSLTVTELNGGISPPWTNKENNKG